MIKLVISILQLMSIARFQELNDEFYPPSWPKFKSYIYELSNSQKLRLHKDEESGCLCREYPNMWTVCFGSDSCRRFPSATIINSTTLKIQTTLINSIRKDEMGRVSHLESLDIEGNDLLSTIEGGTFRNMSKLCNMSISYNSKLKALQNDTFEGLINLKELFLVKNGFNNVIDVSVALSPRVLPSIFKISLSENSFREIKTDDFSSMVGSNLRELNLVLCQIEHISSTSLIPLTNLSNLRLGENRFNVTTITELIVKSVEVSIPLTILNLFSVGFRNIPPTSLLQAIADSNITHLSLARNQFEVIKENSFPEMSKLQYLDLREVLVTNIIGNAFVDMSNLRTLLLSGNKLSSVPDGALLEQLTYLDLSSNSGNAFLPSYFSIGRNKFVKMKKLKYLNLSYNRINTLFNDTFTGLAKLRVLGLRNASIYHIFDAAFLPLHELLVLNLENNHFAGGSSLTNTIFIGLKNLQVLLLGGCSISHISAINNPFQNLTSLAHLGLENNHLVSLSPDVLKPFPNLVTIDISKNFLSPWQKSLFTYNKKLSVVLASRNKLSYLSEAMLEDFSNLSRLDVSENPFACECSLFLSLAKWLERDKNGTLMRLISMNPGFCVYPDEVGDETILQYFGTLQNGSRTCSFFYETRLYLLYVLPFTALTVLVLAIGILAYLYRWHIRYWIFLARVNIRRYGYFKSKPSLRSYANYQYDAFVSYSNEDRNFVIRLVAMLENFEPFLKLCVYERDFQIGSVISETVLASVQQSRKTLLIISDSYARSQWCRWEVQIAEHHRLFFEDIDSDDDSLVMIKLGDVHDTHCTPILRYLMKTRIYLQWDSDSKKQKIFWDKLRNILTPPKTIYDSTV